MKKVLGMAWILYALSAAVLWGAVYLGYELLLKNISAATILFLGSLGSTVVFLCWLISTQTFEKDWQLLKKGAGDARLLVAITLMGILANLTFLASMKLKNATVSGLIEITYPLFTALFAWIFIRESQLSAGTLAGACLIMAGIACISYFEKTT